MTPVKLRSGCYLPPTEPGYSITMKSDSLDQFEFPHGPVWTARSAVMPDND